jgi:hypothetical protein
VIKREKSDVVEIEIETSRSCVFFTGLTQFNCNFVVRMKFYDDRCQQQQNTCYMKCIMML